MIRQISLLFVLLVSLKLVAAPSAVIYWISEPIDPGSTALFAGSYESPSEMEVSMRNADEKEIRCEIISRSPNTFIVRIPRELSAGPIEYKFLAGKRVVRRGFINAPHVWWAIGPSSSGHATPRYAKVVATAYPDSDVRFFGSSLGKTVRTASLVAAGNLSSLSVKSGDTWQLTAHIPGDTPLGEYTAILCADRSQHICSEPYPLRIIASPASHRQMVRASDFGADPHDGIDDTDSIQRALEAASNVAPADVVLEQGHYLISRPIHIPQRVTLRGAGMALTSLNFPDVDTPPPVWLTTSSDSAVEDMTIFCANHDSVIATESSATTTPHGIALRRLTIRANAYMGHLTQDQVAKRFASAWHAQSATLQFTGAGIEISDCDIFGSGRPFKFSDAVDVVIRRNKFYNGRWGWYNFDGCENVVVEKNTIDGGDAMATGGSYAAYVSAMSRNFFTAENTYRRLYGWDREAFTSDAGGEAYHGPVAVAEANRLTLAGMASWGTRRNWQGALVAIVSGRGAGQWRYLDASDGTRVELNKPFDVSPDNTSQVAVTMLHLHYIFVSNRFEDVGIAIQFYGTAVEHIVVGNTCIRAGGFVGRALFYAGGVQPILDSQWLDNSLPEGLTYYYYNGSQFRGGTFLGVEAASPLSFARAVVIRGNSLGPNSTLHVISAPGHLSQVIIEQNSIADPNGIDVADVADSFVERRRTP